MTNPPRALVEKVARAINDLPFRSYQSLYAYCLGQGDSEDEARKIAGDTHQPDIDKALGQATATLSVLPDTGWRLVPEVPTEAMLKVGSAAIEDIDLAEPVDLAKWPWWGGDWAPCVIGAWTAMLSAAPAPETPDA